MKYKPYSTAVWDRIHQTLDKVCKTLDRPIAAFDADGTLWDVDLGENFFQYQIDRNLVALPKDPWNHYLQMKKVNGDPRSAYLWLAQINKDQNLSLVREWAQEAFSLIQPKPIFDEQQKLIQLLQERSIPVKIVTASIQWAVEPGALALGLKREDVVGVKTVVKNDVITEEPIYPITYRSGKVEALKSFGSHFFASGNSIGDLELLEAATELGLAVSAASRDDKLYRSEAELYEAIKKNQKCLYHRFI